MIVPAILVAVVVYELGVILEFAGIFILVLSGICIPLTAIAAQKIIPEKSEYDFSNNFVIAFLTFGVSVLLMILSLIFIFI